MSVLSKSNDVCRVTILVLPESSMMCVASVLEPLRAANRVAGQPLYDWKLTSLNGTSIDMTCDVPLEVTNALDSRMEGDLLIIIGGFNHWKHVSSAEISVIRKAASGFAMISGVEAGSWIVARAGLINGYSATTHWEDYEAFAVSFPEVDVQPDRYVIDRNRMTCGGASPALDMFLDMIRQRNGPEIAMEVASVFIYDQTHSRSDAQPLVSLGGVARHEPRVARAIQLMEKWIEQPLPVAAIARRLDLSSNTLEALFRKHLGMTPGRYYLNLRLKVANRMVLDTGLSMREIAVRSGFNSLSAFSRAYRQMFSHTPRGARALRH